MAHLCNILGIAALCAAGAAIAGPAAPDVDAVVRYETRQVMSTGVTRVDTWQERLVRRGDQVWTERVSRAKESAEEHAAHKEAPGRSQVSLAPSGGGLGLPSPRGGHQHFNFESAARLVRREAKGVDLKFVDVEHKVVVSVPAPEYGAVGFDGRWDAAAHLVPPSLVERLPVQASVQRDGTSLRVQKAQGWTHRVWWSDARQIALRIESQRDDGSFRRVVVLEPQAPLPDGKLPWQGLGGFTQREYDDFLD